MSVSSLKVCGPEGNVSKSLQGQVFYNTELSEAPVLSCLFETCGFIAGTIPLPNVWNKNVSPGKFLYLSAKGHTNIE